MGYVIFILVILGILTFCIVLVRRNRGRWPADRRHGRLPPADEPGFRVIEKLTDSNRLVVPTPWGWPGNEPGAPVAGERSVSQSLHYFVDHLLAEKQNVKDSEYQLKRNENLRSLIESRYGMSRRSANGLQ